MLNHDCLDSIKWIHYCPCWFIAYEKSLLRKSKISFQSQKAICQQTQTSEKKKQRKN